MTACSVDAINASGSNNLCFLLPCHVPASDIPNAGDNACVINRLNTHFEYDTVAQANKR
jgi:hypothetical protein